MLRICMVLLMHIVVVIFGGGNHDVFNFNFQQSDYKLVAERMDVVRYNKQLVKRFEIVTFKYNRTCTAFNLTLNFNFNVNNKMEIIVQAYKFASNEYRLFPLRFEFNYCAAISFQTFGYGQRTCGNFSGCSFPKGRTYRLCNWKPDESKFPPYIPTGRYMVELQGTYLSNELWVCRFYGAVTRPFVK